MSGWLSIVRSGIRLLSEQMQNRYLKWRLKQMNQKMIQAGLDPDEVMREEGFVKGPDGLWRPKKEEQ